MGDHLMGSTLHPSLAYPTGVFVGRDDTLLYDLKIDCVANIGAIVDTKEPAILQNVQVWLNRPADLIFWRVLPHLSCSPRKRLAVHKYFCI